MAYEDISAFNIVAGYQYGQLHMTPLHNLAFTNIDQFRGATMLQGSDNPIAIEQYNRFIGKNHIVRKLNNGAFVVSNPTLSGDLPFTGTKMDFEEKSLEINQALETRILIENLDNQETGDAEQKVQVGLRDLHNKFISLLAKNILTKYRATASQIQNNVADQLIATGGSYPIFKSARDIIKNATKEYEGTARQYAIINPFYVNRIREFDQISAHDSTLSPEVRANVFGRGDLDPNSQFVRRIQDADIYQDFALQDSPHMTGYQENLAHLRSSSTSGDNAVGDTTIKLTLAQATDNAIEINEGDVIYFGLDTDILYPITNSVSLEADNTSGARAVTLTTCKPLEKAIAATTAVFIVGNTAASTDNAELYDAFYFEKEGLSSFTKLRNGTRGVARQITDYAAAIRRGGIDGFPPLTIGQINYKGGIPMIAPRNDLAVSLLGKSDDFGANTVLSLNAFWNAQVNDERRVVRILHAEPA